MARREAAAAPDAPPPADRVTPEGPPESLPQPLTDADMPPLDGLRYDDDWSGFLSPGVSDELRGEALRRLFSSPELNVTDGLDSYSGDYTSFEALGDAITADMRHRIERLLDAGAPPEATVSAGEAEGSPSAGDAPAVGTAGPLEALQDRSEDAAG
jgi:hypothetical protein